jgi:hypothetical protein
MDYIIIASEITDWSLERNNKPNFTPKLITGKYLNNNKIYMLH